MKYKIAIFDLDGTILDTLDDLTDSMNYSLAAHALPSRSKDDIRRFVGNGIHRLVELSVPSGTDSDMIERVFNTFHGYYKDHCAVKTCPYDGINNVIKTLKDNDIITAVVSNKADYAVRSLCEEYFKGLFDYSVGDREGQRRKPYPDSVNAVLSHFDLTSADAVYIGDSEVDIQTAHNAGTDLIMVSWGFRDRQYLLDQGAVFVISAPDEILGRII